MKLARHPEYASLVNVIIKLKLVSHAPTASIESNTSSNNEDSSGMRPRGGIPAFDDFQVEYRQKSDVYFEMKLKKCRTRKDLSALLLEALEALESWKKTPVTAIEPMPGDPLFPRWVANHEASDAELARLTGLSRQAINGIRRRYVRRAV